MRDALVRILQRPVPYGLALLGIAVPFSLAGQLAPVLTALPLVLGGTGAALTLLGVSRTTWQAMMGGEWEVREEFLGSKDALPTFGLSQEDRKAAYVRLASQVMAIRSMSPAEFEQMIRDLFCRMGFTVEATARAPRTGFELLVHKGRRSAVVHCFLLRGLIPEGAAEAVYGARAAYGVKEAYVITSGAVGLTAMDFAEGKPIQLVDCVRLVEWLDTFPAPHIA